MKPGSNLFRRDTPLQIPKNGADHRTPIDNPIRIGTVIRHQIHRIPFSCYSACLDFSLRGKLDRHGCLPFKGSLLEQSGKAAEGEALQKKATKETFDEETHWQEALKVELATARLEPGNSETEPDLKSGEEAA